MARGKNQRRKAARAAAQLEAEATRKTDMEVSAQWLEIERLEQMLAEGHKRLRVLLGEPEPIEVEEGGPFCIVYRKKGDVEQVWYLSEMSGATRKAANDFRTGADMRPEDRHYSLAAQWGGDTGRHTTTVEPESDHPGW
jgi:hypothetical protein